MQWYLNVMKQYATFTGRARRTEYWMFVLCYIIIAIIAGILDGIAGTAGMLGGLVALVHILPSLAVGARRLHDVGRSGWWLLLALTGIGSLVLLFWAVSDSEAGSNAFGANPKNGADPAAPA